MIQEIKRNKFSFVILGFSLILMIVLYLGAWPNRSLQREIAILLAVFYVVWGVLTHYHDHTFSKKIFLEYLGVGFLSGLLLIFITI